MSSRESQLPSNAGQFKTTRWSVVLAARLPDAAPALANICQNYWYPLYVFVRRQGYSPHDAQDLTQAFFSSLLEKNFLAEVERSKGRFRSFLLAALKHFLSNERERARAQKRGGGRPMISIDEQSAETRYRIEPADVLTPEKLFERRWALTLLEKVLADLRQEYARDGKNKLFEQLKDCLVDGKHSIPYAELAARAGSSEGAIKVAVHRLRRRYRELLRAEIARTVASADEVEDELRHLFAAVSG
jgi:RNA polymerase sigma-70 factor (ECF subfamily)